MSLPTFTFWLAVKIFLQAILDLFIPIRWQNHFKRHLKYPPPYEGMLHLISVIVELGIQDNSIGIATGWTVGV